MNSDKLLITGLYAILALNSLMLRSMEKEEKESDVSAFVENKYRILQAYIEEQSTIPKINNIFVITVVLRQATIAYSLINMIYSSTHLSLEQKDEALTIVYTMIKHIHKGLGVFQSVLQELYDQKIGLEFQDVINFSNSALQFINKDLNTYLSWNKGHHGIQTIIARISELIESDNENYYALIANIIELIRLMYSNMYELMYYDQQVIYPACVRDASNP